MRIHTGRHTASAAVALVLTFTIGQPASAEATGSPDIEACEPDASARDDARALRTAVGLPSDELSVAESFQRPEYLCSYGIPMRDDERAIFEQVLNAQAGLTNIASEVSTRDGFAGAWLEADMLVVATTSGKLALTTKPELGQLQVRTARFGLPELNDVARRVIDELNAADLRSTAIDVTRVEVDPRTNRVEVGVAGDVAEATAHFASTFGPAVNVSSVPRGEGGLLACTINDCGTRGGVAINHSGPTSQCSSGFLVKAKFYTSTTWSRYILTAGHCVNDAGGPTNTNKWSNPSGTVTWGTNGKMDFDLLSCGIPLCDALQNDQGLIKVGTASPASWNQYNINGSPASITGAVSDANQLVGQVLCRTGRTSGWNCGAITAKPAMVSIGIPALRLYDSVEVKMKSDHGDSGAGFYRVWDSYGTTRRDAYGTLTSGQNRDGTNYTFYFPWDGPFYSAADRCDLWNIQICTTAACAL